MEAACPVLSASYIAVTVINGVILGVCLNLGMMGTMLLFSKLYRMWVDRKANNQINVSK